MTNLSLDQWGVITPTGEMKKPLILSDAHAERPKKDTNNKLMSS